MFLFFILQRQHRSRIAGCSRHEGTSAGFGNNEPRTAAQRRARSEGPINRRPRWRATSFRDEIRPTTAANNSSNKINVVGGSQRQLQVK